MMIDVVLSMSKRSISSIIRSIKNNNDDVDDDTNDRDNNNGVGGGRSSLLVLSLLRSRVLAVFTCLSGSFSVSLSPGLFQRAFSGLLFHTQLAFCLLVFRMCRTNELFPSPRQCNISFPAGLSSPGLFFRSQDRRTDGSFGQNATIQPGHLCIYLDSNTNSSSLASSFGKFISNPGMGPVYWSRERLLPCTFGWAWQSAEITRSPNSFHSCVWRPSNACPVCKSR